MHQQFSFHHLILILILVSAFMIVPASAAGDYTMNVFWNPGTSVDNQSGPTGGIAVDDSGMVYAIDYHQIFVFDATGKQTAIWGPPDGTGTAFSPLNIWITPTGTISVYDSAKPPKILTFSPSGTLISRQIATGEAYSDTVVPPHYIVGDISGNLYAFGHGNGTYNIRKLSSDGRLLARWGSYGYGDEQFINAIWEAFCVDSHGNVYVGDFFETWTDATYLGTSRIRKFDTNGNLVSVWKQYKDVPGTYELADGEFKYPSALAVDTFGNIYVGDRSGRVQKFDSTGTFISRLDEDGENKYVKALAVDRSGNVFVGDPRKGRIVKYTPTASGILAGIIPQQMRTSATPTLVINDRTPDTTGLPVMPETIPILQPDGQVSLAGAVDNGGVRTYAALEQISFGGSGGNTTVLPRTIPAAAVLPPEAIPAAAAATGALAGAVAAGAATASGTGLLAQILAGLKVAFGKITAFLKGVLEEYLIKWISKVDIFKRGIDAIRRFFQRGSVTKEDPEHVLITPREIVVLLISPLVLAAAFILAEKTWNLPAAIGIYVIIAAVAMIARDLVQKMVARHYAIPSELRFWGLGTLILFLTGGYFGNVFGAATRFDLNEAVANEESGAARKKVAFVALAGPVISIVLAAAFISLFPLGGLFYLVAITGFSMNLMSAAYAMMPFIPMEGADVYRWHAKVWLLMFVPLILGYMIIVTPLHLI